MNEKSNPNEGPKIEKENNVVSKMIGLYCEKKHGSEHGNLCEDCANLKEYSHHRLDYCRYGEDKPSCRKCETHCYNPEMRNRIRLVMRFSGPRLALRAPVDWIRHHLHERE